MKYGSKLTHTDQFENTLYLLTTLFVVTKVLILQQK